MLVLPLRTGGCTCRAIAPDLLDQRIRVCAAQREGWWVISIADNGIGIEPKYATQIFGLFKRLHSRSE